MNTGDLIWGLLGGFVAARLWGAILRWSGLRRDRDILDELLRLREEHDEAIALLGDDGAALGLTESIKRRTFLLRMAENKMLELRARVDELEVVDRFPSDFHCRFPSVADCPCESGLPFGACHGAEDEA